MAKTVRENKYLWLSLLIGMTVTLVVMLPRLSDPYSTEDDFLNWYWMHRFQDRELFLDDYVTRRNVIEVTMGPVTLITYKASPLYGLLFQLLSYFMPIILIGKLLVFPLNVILICYLYRITERLTSSKAAMIICTFFVFLNLILPSLVSTMGGFQRSFVLPLLLAFLYYWWYGRYGVTLIILFFAAGFYPPLFVLLIVTVFLELTLSWWAGRDMLTGNRYILYWVGIVLFAFIVFLWPFGGDLIHHNVTEALAQLSDNSKYGPGGRTSLFYIAPLVGRGGIADHGLTIIIIIFLALFASIIVSWQPQRLHQLPRIFKSLFGASWIMFILAWGGYFLTGSFPLYFPSRYTQAAVLLILFIFVAVHAADAWRSAARSLTMNSAALSWLNLPLAGLLVVLFFLLPESREGTIAFGRGPSRWLLLILAVLLVVLSLLIRNQRSKTKLLPSSSRNISAGMKNLGIGLLLIVGIGIVYLLHPLMNYTYYRVTDSELKLYTYLQTLPKDVLLSGNPAISNPIPMYSKRQVLLTLEHLGPDEMTIIDALFAYYTDDPADLLYFCEKYGVDYLIVDERDFVNKGKTSQPYFYEPYNSVIAPIIAQKTTFVLGTLPDSVRSFQVDNWYVVACEEEVLEH